MKKIAAFLLISRFTLSAMSQQPDSVTVMGQLLDNCSFSKIYIKEFSLTNGQSYTAEANAFGYFKVKVPVDGAKQYSLNAGKSRRDFIITPNQTEYRFTITCNPTGDFNVKLEDSKENSAFDMLGKIERHLVYDCADIINKNPNPDSLYHALKDLCRTQDYNLQQVANNFPNTFTTTVLVPACNLPVNFPRQNFLDSFVCYGLKDSSWNNPQLYNTDIPLNYLRLVKTLFSKKSEAEKDGMIYDLLSAGPVNLDAAKLYQQSISEYLFYQLEENRLRAFCKWADEHPDKIPNPTLKARMQGMKRVLPGSDFINITLKDSTGAVRSLASEVSSHAYTLVLFWSPGCEHCIAEMPALISFYKKYQPLNVEVFAVAIDCETAKWKNFIAEKTPAWVNVHDEGGHNTNLAADYMINYTPTLVLIDKAGKIQSRFGSLEWVERILHENGVK